jgi:nicotinamidase-related amidase
MGPGTDTSITAINIACQEEREFSFAPKSTAFLAIDMQKDFLSADGWCAARYGDPVAMRAIVPRFKALTGLAREAGCTVIHTREGYAPGLSDVHAMKAARGVVGEPGPLGRFLIRGEAGHDFVDELRPAPGEAVVDKPGFGAFYSTGLEAMLRAAGITHLILAGITTQCCVHSTLREAVDRGFWCLTVVDCCAAIETAWHDAAIALIPSEAHLFGWVCDLDDLRRGLGH